MTFWQERFNWLSNRKSNKRGKTRRRRPAASTRRRNIVERLEDRRVMAANFSESFDNYAGTGFEPGGANGRLDSDVWSGRMGTTEVAFGGTAISGSLAGGVRTNPSSTTGLQAFTLSGDRLVGIQPAGSTFQSPTNGHLTLRVQNDSVAANSVTVSYEAFYNNDQARSNNLLFSYSTDGTNFTPVPSASVTSPAAADSNGLVSAGTINALTNASIDVAPNAFFFVRWTGADVSGSNNRDEFGIDDVSVVLTGTVDTTPPTVASLLPADDAINVLPSANLVVTFSEAVVKGSGNVEILRVSDNVAVYSVPVTDASISISGAVATINPPADLAGSTDYYVNIDAGAFRDLATVPNDFAGITGNTAWNFTTATVDTTPPTLTSITDSVSGGPSFTNQPITFTVTFSEDIIDSGDGAVTAADFNNAGTSAVTFGAISETSPGVFNVVVTPTTTGTVQLRIPTTAVISDLGGNNLDVAAALLDDTIITINAVTTLTVGDIAFTGIQTDAPDQFSFVLLKDVVPGTQISFTDNGWGDGSFANTSENTATVTFGSAVAAGTHLYVIDQSGGAFRFKSDDSSAGTIVGNLNGLSASGDSILAYQGDVPTSNDATNWIAGINTRSFAANPGNTNQSNLPSALQIGVTAIQLSNTATDVDNGAYNLAGFEGTVDQIRASVKNIANWTTNNNIGPNSTTVFTVSADTTPPTVTSIDDNDPDDTVLVNEMLTYTITFSEDIIDSGDGAVTAADFDNAGSSAITIGTITETSAGVFSVQVTPTTAGTLQLRIPTGAVITDLAGNALVAPVTHDTVITVNASDVTPPTVVSITDDDADDIIGVGATVTYTVTFSEDIDGTFVNENDFNNAGTSTFTIGTIIQTAPGAFTVPVTATSEGTVQLQIPTTATIQDLAGNALVVDPAILDAETITVDGTAPTLTSIADNVSGGPVFMLRPITFTVTFNEDIDATTVTAVDFDNAGTATIAIGAVTESATLPGVFTVVVTPTTAGTVQLRIPTSAVIADVAGNNLDVTAALLDDTTITVNAVTTLTAGDIAFTSFQSDDPDRFSFVLLKDIADGTSITFTDSRWNDVDNTLATNENTMTVVFFNTGLGFSAGTHFVYDNAVSPVGPRVLGSTEPAGTVTGAISGLATGGDSILAYQGFVPADGNSAAWIAGINSRSWNNSPIGNSQSALPTALTVGVNAIQLTDTATDIDNGGYQPTLFIGSIAQIRASVNNIANWQTSNVPGPVSTTEFIIGAISTELLISEVVFDPEAVNDTGEEYIELRGTPNAFVPADAYLVLLEGDSEDGPGLIDHIFFIGGMQFGSNGFLVLRQFGSTYEVDPGATVFTATSAGWGADWSSRDTDIENGSVTVMLMQSAVAPIAGTDVDDDNNGAPDGVATSWAIRDAIGNIDGGLNDTAYGFLNTSGNGNGLVPVGSSLINLGGYHPDYMARNGNSTGHTLLTTTASDWVVGELAGAMPNITLATGTFTRPSVFAGAQLDHLGALNQFDESTLADPVLTLTAPNAVYTGVAYAGASVTITGEATPAPSPVFTYYVGAQAVGTPLASAPINVGTYTVVASTAANAGNNAATSGPVTFQITPAQLLVTGLTGNNKVYDATDAATVSGTAAVAALGSDVVTVSGTPAFSFANKNVGNAKPITATGYTLSGADAANYVIVQPTGLTGNITPATLIPVVTVLDKVFDGNTTATINTRTLDGILSGDVVSLIGGVATFNTPDVGANKPVLVVDLQLSGADAGNYVFNSTVNTTATIAVGPSQDGPKVTSVQINGADTYLNNNQRSHLTSVRVNFDQAVTLASGAFRIENANTGVVIAASQLVITPNGASDSFTIRFAAGPGVVERLNASSNGNSLVDGNYRLVIDASKVSAGGDMMASNFVYGNESVDNFFRLFGDSDGDGDVDARDMAALRLAIRGLGYNAALDANGNGVIVGDTADVNAFAANRNKFRPSL